MSELEAPRVSAVEPGSEFLSSRAIAIAGGATCSIGLGVALFAGSLWSALFILVIAGLGIAQHNVQRTSGRDELDALTSQVEQMRAGLNAIADDVRARVDEVKQASAQIGATGSELGADARRHQATVTGSIGAIERMATSSREVRDTLTRLSPHASETASSVSTLDASIWEVAENTDEFRQLMEEVASASSQLSSAVGQIAQGAVSLGESTDATRERLTRLESSVRSVENNAAATHTVSEEALDHARVGIERVRELAGGMRDIDDSFRGVQQTIERLADRSASIEDIVGLIDEIVSRTHLLALNASIIAAQAGEQGRAFSVVASEVRDLADLTADSTKEIAGHVAAVREQVDGAVEAVEVGAARVAAGTALSDAADASLQQIHDGSEQATAMTREIAMATEEQSAELTAVGASMNQVATLVQQIGQATREQNASSQLVLGKLDDMRGLAQRVAEACSKQAGNSRQITEATAALAEGIEEIRRSTEAQSQVGDEVLGNLREVLALAEAGLERADTLGVGLNALDGHTGQLAIEAERLDA
jgi:methyl-accepting chemotaxis protein